MPIRRTEFESGLRVVTERMPAVRSVALGFWVLAGSRDERQAVIEALRKRRPDRNGRLATAARERLARGVGGEVIADFQAAGLA